MWDDTMTQPTFKIGDRVRTKFRNSKTGTIIAKCGRWGQWRVQFDEPMEGFYPLTHCTHPRDLELIA